MKIMPLDNETIDKVWTKLDSWTYEKVRESYDSYKGMFHPEIENIYEQWMMDYENEHFYKK